jgi:hypothetical protein
MLNQVFDKTDIGREEIKTRKYGLAPKLRPLLVLIDGKHSGQALLKKFSYLGLTEQLLSELVQQGFIVASAPEETDAAPASNLQVAAGADPGSAEAETSSADGILEEGETQFQAVYKFYTHTIKSTLGLRGFGMQLKVEKCSAINDFRALRVPYVEAVFKAQGEEMARSLRSRLDQLLYIGEPAPNTIPLNGHA